MLAGHRHEGAFGRETAFAAGKRLGVETGRGQVGVQCADGGDAGFRRARIQSFEDISQQTKRDLLSRQEAQGLSQSLMGIRAVAPAGSTQLLPRFVACAAQKRERNGYFTRSARAAEISALRTPLASKTGAAKAWRSTRSPAAMSKPSVSTAIIRQPVPLPASSASVSG